MRRSVSRWADANDLLQAGHGGYLTAWRFQLCVCKEERDALYYDLWDAMNIDAGLTPAP